MAAGWSSFPTFLTLAQHLGWMRSAATSPSVSPGTRGTDIDFCPGSVRYLNPGNKSSRSSGRFPPERRAISSISQAETDLTSSFLAIRGTVYVTFGGVVFLTRPCISTATSPSVSPGARGIDFGTSFLLD